MTRFALFLSSLLLLAFALAPAAAQEEIMPTFVPIGAGYTDTFDGFVAAARPYVETNAFERVYILMMPISFSYDANVLTAADLLDNSLAIERRRRQLENACADVIADLPCEVVVPPLWTREAALEALALDYFTDDLAAVYFVGGDQTIAMQIIADTPVESALADAYARGVVMGGNSAGLAIQSRAMIGGYLGDFGPETGLHAGAVDMWNETEGADGAPPRRGLAFGLQNAIVEQHFWERARISRALNAMALPDTPNVTVGVDSYTGVLIRDDALVSDVFGLYGAAILDAETLGAADNATFVGDILSIRDVIVHLLPAGDYGYSLVNRVLTFTDALVESGAPIAIRTPNSARSLALWSGLAAGIGAGEVVLESATPHLVIVTGYADPATAEAVGAVYAGASETEIFYLDSGDTLPDLSGYRTVTIHAGDVTLIPVEPLAPVRDYWLNGGALILDDAAALLAGVHYANLPPVPYDSDDDLLIEAALQGALLEGGTPIAEGWGLIDANIEVAVMDDNRFARLFALAASAPERPTLGLSIGTMIDVGHEVVFVSPASVNGVYALSFADALISVGANGGIGVANGLLDVFAPGEDIQ
jgi:cyanophycinase